MAARLEKPMLLKNKNEAAKIGPFDGLVGCIIGSGEYFVTSANQKFIPLPPLGSNRPLQLRSDFLYGDDDPIRWPQPFNVNFCHYPCIPRFSKRRPEQVMWWRPTRDAFTPITSSLLPVTGIGKLAFEYCSEIEKHVNALLIRVEAYLLKTPPARVPPFLGPLVQMTKHSLTRLQSVAMTFSQMEFQVRDVQRSWMEVLAILDYMGIYRPRMNATEGTVVAKHSETAATMGTFTSDLRVAQDHFQAGLPYWLIQPANAFNEQNILEVRDPHHPDLYLIDLTVHRFRNRILAEGRAGTDDRYNAIHRQARNIMRYSDPFDHGTTANIDIAPGPSTSRLPDVAPPALSSIGPVRQQPEKGRMGSGRGRTTNNRGVTRAMPNAVNPRAGRSKFEPIDSSLMPLPILSWQDALKAVDTDASHLDPSNRSNPHDGKYLFPDPGILANVTNTVRQARYFETWKNTRTICLFRAFQASSPAIPLSGQDWRNFLVGNLGGTFNGPRNQEVQKKVQDIFSNCLNDMQLNFQTFMPPPETAPPPIVPEEAQRVLWELSELNFRFELLALDKRSSGSVGDEETQDRQDLITRCFPATTTLIVADPSHATQGLASLDWRERLPCLLRLRALMRDWKGHKPTPLLLLDRVDVAMYQEDEVWALENAIAQFYTQSFYNFFGRAAVIPTRLPS